MDSFTTLFISSVLGGTFLVPFVDLVTKDVKSSRASFLIALSTSVVLGAIVTVMQGKVSFNNLQNGGMLLGALGTVFLTSQTIFKLYWQNSLAHEKLSQRVQPTVETPIAQTGEASV